MSRVQAAALGVIIIMLASIVGAPFAPVPLGNDAFEFHVQFAIMIGIATGFMGASIIFIMGLGGFSKKLKRAYRFICLALTVLGFSFLQLPLILYLVPVSTFWKDATALTSIAFVLANIFIYMSARKLAKLFGIQHFSMNILFLLGTIITLAVLVILVPHTSSTTPEFLFDAPNAMNTLNIAAISLGAVILYRVKQIASVMYANALAFMILSYATTALCAAVSITTKLIFGDENFMISIAPVIPLLISALFMVKAAYSFNTITANASDTHGWVARNFFGKPLQPAAQNEISSVDIVIYTAALASNTLEITTLLDPLRQVTAHIKEGEQLSPAQEKTLLEVYRKLETYLTQEEPLRMFTIPTLRQTVAQNLRLTSGHNTFWRQLS